MEAEIPDKLFFKIGEVAALLSLRPSVLRFWETEFPPLRPNKSKSGQRLYTRRDVEVIQEIKRLLYTEKMTIEGARKKIVRQGRVREEGHVVSEALSAILREVRDDLKRIRDSL